MARQAIPCSPGWKHTGPCRLSVIVPNHNGGRTIGRCLAALARADHPSCEVIVVDDGSDDDSLARIRRFPCRLVRLASRQGAAAARNAGAAASRGRLLFFTDADCLVLPETLRRVEAVLRDDDEAVGGTYTLKPADRSFFSRFQSAFIHYSETRNPSRPDYLASHALAITASRFRESGGFRERFLPILEDVEFSHRLRRQGVRLRVEPALQVRHVFGYSLGRSLANGWKKSSYWFRYSLANRDLLSDSGTASRELKVNGCVWLAAMIAVLVPVFPADLAVGLIGGAMLTNLWLNRRLFATFHRAGGLGFALPAALYYLLAYPAAIWSGVMAGCAGALQRREGGR